MCSDHNQKTLSRLASRDVERSLRLIVYAQLPGAACFDIQMCHVGSLHRCSRTRRSESDPSGCRNQRPLCGMTATQQEVRRTLSATRRAEDHLLVRNLRLSRGHCKGISHAVLYQAGRRRGDALLARRCVGVVTGATALGFGCDFCSCLFSSLPFSVAAGRSQLTQREGKRRQGNECGRALMMRDRSHFTKSQLQYTVWLERVGPP